MTKERKNIEVVPYDPRWANWYQDEAEKIKEALGANCLALHHVGSTSIPGLAAKPRIDIIAEVADPEKSITQLKPLGYEYRGEWNIPMKYGFRKRGGPEVNLHVFGKNHPEIEVNLCFRDYLRNHPEVRDEYAQLKLELLKDESSFEKNNSMFAGYSLGKGNFIHQVLKKTGLNRLRFVFCTHINEWDAAKNFRQKYFFDKVPIKDPYEWTFNHKDHIHFILYEGVDIIGYAHIQLWPESRAAVRIIVVDDNKRGRGFGGQFLNWIEVWLKAKGYKSIHTESSPDAVRFYKNQAYTEMPFNDPDGYEGDERDTPMGKILESPPSGDS